MDTSKLRGLSLLVGGMFAWDIFSAFMSSPWSTEAFGGDTQKAASARRLVQIGAITAVTAGGTASYLTKSWWPLVGCAGGAAIMWYLYDDALKRAAVNPQANV